MYASVEDEIQRRKLEETAYLESEKTQGGIMPVLN
jgi:hypothetical protein